MADSSTRWSPQHSAALYGIANWGGDYFSVSPTGRVLVHAGGEENPSVDLLELVEEIRDRGLHTPLLVRFTDILASRVKEIFADFERIILPGITHWNHPGFFAYFAISGSGPGVLAEFLSAALNVQAMLWRTSPAATELEEVTLAWLRQLLGLPDEFAGVIYDTASISTLHALAAARFQLVGEQVEMVFFAEEGGQVRREAVHELLPLGIVRRCGLQRAQVVGERAVVQLAQPAREAAVDHRLLAGVQADAGMLVNELAHALEIGRAEVELLVGTVRGLTQGGEFGGAGGGAHG